MAVAERVHGSSRGREDHREMEVSSRRGVEGGRREGSRVVEGGRGEGSRVVEGSRVEGRGTPRRVERGCIVRSFRSKSMASYLMFVSYVVIFCINMDGQRNLEE